MKKLFKSLVSLTAAGTMLLSTTAFAAENLSTVTRYDANTDTATVTSTVKSTKAGEMITYLATKDNGNDYDVNATGSNIVYIGQQTATTKGQELKFEYNLTDVNSATYAQVRSGSSDTEALTDSVYVGVGNVTVEYIGYNSGVEPTIVGNGDEVNVTLPVPVDYEKVRVTVNGADVDPTQNAIKAKAGDKIVVTVVPTTGNAAVYVLGGATVETDSDYSGDKYSVISGVVKIVGDVETCAMSFYNNSERVADSLLKIDETAKFAIFDISGSGYYGVEVVGSANDNLGSYKYVNAVYTVSGADTEQNATIIE